MPLRCDQDWYSRGYYVREVNEAHRHGLLKIQDEAAALCYALGAAGTWEEVEEVMGVLGDGLHFPGNVSYRPGHVYQPTTGVFEDSVYVRGETAIDQVNRARLRQTRPVEEVLDIGGGDGTLAWACAAAGIRATCVEPSKAARDLFYATRARMAIQHAAERAIAVPDLDGINLVDVDTIIFCSSIEHIYPDDREMILDAVLPALRENYGRLIIVNTLDNHPIAAAEVDHVARIDDAFFEDLITRTGGKVCYRRGSHLVLDFAPSPMPAP